MATMLYEEARALRVMHLADAERSAQEALVMREQLERRSFFRRYHLRRILHRVTPALAAWI